MAGIDKIYGTATQWVESHSVIQENHVMHALEFWWTHLTWSQAALVVAIAVVVYCAAFLTATARFPWNEPRR